MTGPIVVINPNSNQAVTDGLADALTGFQLQGGPAIECQTLAEGPFGIESQADSDLVVAPLIELVKRRDDASAFVIACYSDPGLEACRTLTNVPVFGIQESGVLVALADKFGLPIHAIGVGEQIEDLDSFDPEEFAAALTGLDNS